MAMPLVIPRAVILVFSIPESTLAYRTYGNQPLWPAEIWEGQIDILIFVALHYLAPLNIKGSSIRTLCILYSTARFFLEFCAVTM